MFQKKLAAVYSPAFPLIFHQYVELLTSEDRQGKGTPAADQRLGLREHESAEITAKIASEVRPQRRHTLLESAHNIGGISVFIYLFAKVGFTFLPFWGQMNGWLRELMVLFSRLS